MDDAGRLFALETENARLRQGLLEMENHNRLLLSELKMRVSNTIAIVRSIARRTAQASETLEDCAMQLDGRLGAVTRAQGLILRESLSGVRLDEIMAEELLAHTVHEGDQVNLSGPPIRLRVKAAATIMLTVHELTVNAVKFGALAETPGRLDVAWRVEQRDGEGGDLLRLEWLESGVAPGPKQRRRGFGFEMIERTLPYDLGAETTIEFMPDGIRCTIVMPFTDDIAVMELDA